MALNPENVSNIVADTILHVHFGKSQLELIVQGDGKDCTDVMVTMCILVGLEILTRNSCCIETPYKCIRKVI